VILSDYAKGILTDELVHRIAKLAPTAKKFIALDPEAEAQARPSTGST
jgi:D-beta-D-heptose 7-phosphate kinase/D-beta-D-heptose 1-phosphate adenosyltransferase